MNATGLTVYWILLALTGVGFAQDAVEGAAPSVDVLQSLVRADDERVEAMTGADRERLNAVFSDELRYSHSNGKVDTKASFVEALAEKKFKYAAIRYQEREFTLASPTVALMTGSADFHFGTVDAAPVTLGFLAVWRFEEGAWRFLAWQSFRMPKDTQK